MAKTKWLPARPDVVVHQAEFAGGQVREGVDQGPKALVHGGLRRLLETDIKLATSFQHIHPQQPHSSELDHGRLKNAFSVGRFNQELGYSVYETSIKHKFALTLGGDHSIAIGSVTGTASAVHDLTKGQSKLAVVWIDAHADINTPDTSPSGNMHGMPVAFLTGIADGKNYNGFEWMESRHLIETGNLVYIGLRDVDDSEKAILKEHQIKAFFMSDVNRLGIDEVVRQTVNVVANHPVHVQFDIDALDAELAPSTGFPVAGGLSLEQAQYLLTALRHTEQVIALDIVEINPKLDLDGVQRTLEAGTLVAKWVLGSS